MALLHGQLKAKEKEAVMEAFAAGEVEVLVATTVVEVGVDVPNATRHGDPQPRALRSGPAAPAARADRPRRHAPRPAGCCATATWPRRPAQRLRFFADHADGFALAEEDLRRAGPGDAWGVRQHGAPGFRLANPLRDDDLVQVCREDARALLEADPQLTGPDRAGRAGAGLEQGLPGGVLPLLAG